MSETSTALACCTSTLPVKTSELSLPLSFSVHLSLLHSYIWSEMFSGHDREEFWLGLDDQVNEGDFRLVAAAAFCS